MFVPTDETIPLLANQPTPRQDDYEAEVALRVLKKSEVVPFMVNGYEPSHVLFPTLMRRYLTGSRAEFLYTNHSDYDYLYEIGVSFDGLDEMDKQYLGYYVRNLLLS